MVNTSETPSLHWQPMEFSEQHKVMVAAEVSYYANPKFLAEQREQAIREILRMFYGEMVVDLRGVSDCIRSGDQEAAMELLGVVIDNCANPKIKLKYVSKEKS